MNNRGIATNEKNRAESFGYLWVGELGLTHNITQATWGESWE